MRVAAALGHAVAAEGDLRPRQRHKHRGHEPGERGLRLHECQQVLLEGAAGHVEALNPRAEGREGRHPVRQEASVAGDDDVAADRASVPHLRAGDGAAALAQGLHGLGVGGRPGIEQAAELVGEGRPGHGRADVQCAALQLHVLELLHAPNVGKDRAPGPARRHGQVRVDARGRAARDEHGARLQGLGDLRHARRPQPAARGQRRGRREDERGVRGSVVRPGRNGGVDLAHDLAVSCEGLSAFNNWPVAGAAADVAVNALLKLTLVASFAAVLLADGGEELHYHPGRAKAALRPTKLRESFCDGVRLCAAVGDALHGDDSGAMDAGQRRQAGRQRPQRLVRARDCDGTGATAALGAADLGTSVRGLASDVLVERLSGRFLNLHRLQLPVQRELHL
mmetsp:Transcript_91769/g.259811  ORF Transcript_91769/g.259811 Transcript_91769/m.259811 type:complete len:395 (+) Transcript_91769:3135-4319(+)